MTSYDCAETYRRMQDFLDRELTEDERRLVQEHLDGCGICAEEYVFEAAMLRRVRGSLADVPVPDDLFGRVAEALDRA